MAVFPCVASSIGSSSDCAVVRSDLLDFYQHSYRFGGAEINIETYTSDMPW